MTATPEQMRALADLPRSNLALYEFELRGALRSAADRLESVHEALSRHPKCDKHDQDDVVSCGWKTAVRDITWAFNGKADAP